MLYLKYNMINVIQLVELFADQKRNEAYRYRMANSVMGVGIKSWESTGEVTLGLLCPERGSASWAV